MFPSGAKESIREKRGEGKKINEGEKKGELRRDMSKEAPELKKGKEKGGGVLEGGVGKILCLATKGRPRKIGAPWEGGKRKKKKKKRGEKKGW